MSQSHTVEQGEHLVRIAAQYGFRDFHAVWDHPLNADLKELRQNPNVLYPGDVVQIPDFTKRTEERPTGQVHTFKTVSMPLRLRIVAEDLYERPLAHTDCELRLVARTLALTTDDEGMIDIPIPVDTEAISLTFHEADSTLDEVEISIHVGWLDPIDEPSGERARLNNLGYFAGALDEDDEDGRNLRSAVEEFQCDHKLPLTGICDDATQAKLKEVHGC